MLLFEIQLSYQKNNEQIRRLVGQEEQRWSTTMSKNGQIERRTVYMGNYESITEGGVIREFYYLDGGVIIIKQDGEFKPYLAFTDNLGSILSVVDENGEKVFDASYDAWGCQTVTLNEIGLHRGYTGHEMLNEFGIINMNGRLYDPVLGRFFSPDNYVQAPDNSQNFNRYSYCLNNPLKYTDPSGEFFNLVIGAVVGGYINWMMNRSQWNASGLQSFLVGALSGAVSTGIASGMNVAMAGGNFWKGAAGLASGVSSTGFLAGAAVGASSGFAAGFVSSVCNSWIGGESFKKGLLSGLESGAINALISGLTGGIHGGLDAKANKVNFWTGTGHFDTTGAMSCVGSLPKGFKIGDKIKAKYVGQFEGQRVFESNLLGSLSEEGEYYAFTLPDIGIFAADGVFSSSAIDGKVMMQHEFGHVLQYRIVGKKFYYGVIAKESAMNCKKIWPYNGISHSKYWTETWANYLSKHYFGERWLGMEKMVEQARNFYYPSKNVDLPFLIKKGLLSF